VELSFGTVYKEGLAVDRSHLTSEMPKKQTKRAPKRKQVQEVSRGNSEESSTSKGLRPRPVRPGVVHPSVIKPPDPTGNLVVRKSGTMILRPKPARPGMVHQSVKASKKNVDPSPRQEMASTSRGLARPVDSSKLSSPLPAEAEESSPLPAEAEESSELIFDQEAAGGQGCHPQSGIGDPSPKSM